MSTHSLSAMPPPPPGPLQLAAAPQSRRRGRRPEARHAASPASLLSFALCLPVSLPHRAYCLRHVFLGCLGLFALLWNSGQLASAQLRIQSPKHLIEELKGAGAFEEQAGETIIGSTASFGTPAYGTVLRGKAFYVPDPATERVDSGSHCTPAYCEKIKNEVDQWKKSEATGGPSKVIFFLDRGICTFATKVRIAQACGADAAVVVDRGVSGWSRSYIRFNVIMSDDGTGQDINIPSVLISRADGQLILDAIIAGAGDEPVLLEMEWNIPNRWPVAVEFWTDPGERQSSTFLQQVAPHMLELGPHVRFKTLYSIFEIEGGSGELCLTKGLYKQFPQAYCAFDPAAQSVAHTGSEVVEEALREACLYQITATSAKDLPDSEFSKEFWQYHMLMADPQKGCFFNGEGRHEWGESCSMRLMSEILSSGQMKLLKECIDGPQGRQLLDVSKSNRTWGPIALRVNGARFSGNLDVETAMRVICASTKDPNTDRYRAPECEKLMIEVHKEEAPWLRDAPDWQNFFLVLLFLGIIAACAVALYYRVAKQRLLQEVRREVNAEIQQQIQQYYEMNEERAPPARRGLERQPLVVP
ncbi:PA domain protein [Toxoplasma gondii TgCatPRC2]|uniref:PA domain protein n=1 Tax=Toxoplasma gondii TgCatPRC2 TaxID=1130821 RepID=A0A151H861_TOXGO|nr:PA domain protein [Toxoplasma gondii TgCatPRC2]